MNDAKQTVLIVDDTNINIDILLETLGEDYTVRVARDGSSALRSIEKSMPDLILLDIMMPDMDGFEMCRRIKEDPVTRSIPVIFLTALSGEIDESRGLAMGAVDYITKPFTPAIVKARVRNHLELKAHRDHLDVLVEQKTRELAETHEVLHDHYRRLESVIEGTQVGTWEWNVQSGEVCINDTWAQMLGYTSEELAPVSIRTWERLVHPDDLRHSSELLARHFSGELPYYECECRMRHKDGSLIWIHDRGRLLTRTEDNEPLLMMGTHTNITVYKNLEDQFRQAQKMEAIGLLAGGVAHDFNNILQVIMVNAESVQCEHQEGDRPWLAIEEVCKATERAAELVRQLLAFSRRQAIQPVNVDLNDLIQSVLKMIQRVIGEHIELNFIPGNRLDTVCVDKGQIEQVLMNLCVNARDAMPRGGTLTIRTRETSFDGDFCRDHPWAAAGRYLLIAVADTGHGMDAETLGHVFEPFFTTKGVGEGTGLGLATVYGIVKQHKGLINVLSEPDRGTLFEIYLPASGCAEVVQEVRTQAPVVGGTETILVAEDEPSVMRLVAMILEEAGYTVLTAVNGEAALRAFEENAGRIDLVLLDVMMPGLGGRQVMENLQARYSGTRFLFCSGYSDKAIPAEYVLSEGLRLIRKPFHKAQLLREVRQILDS